MKKLIIAAIAFSSVSYASAQATETKTTAEAQTTVAADEQDKRTPVKLEELPAAVKKTLSSDSYAGWTASSAVWVDGKMPHYEITLMRGEEKNTVKLSKEGQPIA